MTLRKKFDLWATTRVHPTPPAGDGTGQSEQQSTEAAIVAALWQAYREGYRQCSDDVCATIQQGLEER